MKSINKYSILLALIFPLLFLASCKDEDPIEQETVAFMLEFNNTVGGHEAISDHAHVVDGDTFDLSLLRYYVSKIRIYDDSGDEIASYPDTYILVKGEEKNTISLGELNAGQHIHRIVFNVGIDEATNNQSEEDFTSFPSTDPRAIQSPSMHWSWMSGYIFVKIEGSVNGNKVEMHVGTDSLLREVEVLVHENTSAGEMFHLSLDAEITEFFSGLDKNDELITHTMNNMPLAKALVDNARKVFSKSGGEEHEHGKK